MEKESRKIIRFVIGDDGCCTLNELNECVSFINETFNSKFQDDYCAKKNQPKITYLNTGCAIMEILVEGVLCYALEEILDAIKNKFNKKIKISTKGKMTWSYDNVRKITKFIIEESVIKRKTINSLNVINKFSKVMPYSETSLDFCVKNTKFLLEKYKIDNNLVSSKYSSVSSCHLGVFIELCLTLLNKKIEII